MAAVANLARVIEVARSAPDVAAFYLFGSHADGTATASSDFDLAVLGTEPFPSDELVGLQLRFGDAAGKPVDLVDLRTIDAFLALEVIRGERLFCRDEPLADEYELFVMRRAGDLEPFERERRRLAMALPSRPARG
jgi:predicted nucleotidyltransferase